MAAEVFHRVPVFGEDQQFAAAILELGELSLLERLPQGHQFVVGGGFIDLPGLGRTSWPCCG